MRPKSSRIPLRESLAETPFGFLEQKETKGTKAKMTSRLWLASLRIFWDLGLGVWDLVRRSELN
jgi:hypothetical protein